jgi:hypothetical protein
MPRRFHRSKTTRAAQRGTTQYSTAHHNTSLNCQARHTLRQITNHKPQTLMFFFSSSWFAQVRALSCRTVLYLPSSDCLLVVPPKCYLSRSCGVRTPLCRPSSDCLLTDPPKGSPSRPCGLQQPQASADRPSSDCFLTVPPQPQALSDYPSSDCLLTILPTARGAARSA